MSNLNCLSNLRCDVLPLGAPLPGFIYAIRLEFTSVLVEYRLKLPFFISKSSLIHCTCPSP
jgi:hypothetical protein